MKDVLKYKGYEGCVYYDTQDKVHHGRILGINDIITYEGESEQELQEDFENAVDDYLDSCQDLGKCPECPCAGKLELTLPIDLIADLEHLARDRGQNLNDVIVETLQTTIQKSSDKA